MSSIIRSLMVKVGADLTDLDKSMKKMSKNLKSAGRDMQKTGASLTKGLTVPILGAAAGITSMVVAAGKGADELITLSNKTGITKQALQEMEYAARFIDVEVETMTDSMIKLTKNMDNANKGLKDQEEAFQKLGVEYKNNDGSLRNAKEVWSDVIDALGEMSSEADRDAMALRLFGRSAAELNPLIKAGGDELNRLGKEAHEVGAIMNDENVTALGKFDDEMQKLQAVMKTAGGNIGAAFLPVLEKLTPIIQDKIVPAISGFANKISDLINWFSNLSPNMQGVILSVTGLVVAIGPVMMIVGKLTSGIGGLIGGIGAAVKVIRGGGGIVSALGALIGPAGIALAAIVAIAAAAFLIIKNWDSIKEFFMNLWENTKSVFSSAWEFIAGLFIKYTPYGLIIQNWDKITGFFTELWDKTKDIFVLTWEFIKKLFLNYTPTGLVIKHWDKIKDFFSKLWGNVISGITIAWDGIKAFFTQTIPNVIKIIVDGFKSLPSKMIEVGKSIIAGIWNGISSSFEWLSTKIGGVVSSIKGFFTGKNGFDSHSPSRWGEKLGKNVNEGLANGLNASSKLLENAVSDIMGNLNSNAVVDLRANTATSSSDLSMANAIYSGIKSLASSFKTNGAQAPVVVLQVGETELGRVALPGVIKESKRLNLKLSEV